MTVLPIRTIKHNGYNIEVYHDEMFSSRDLRDSPSTRFWGFHSRYNIGDKNPGLSPGDYDSWDEFDAALHRHFMVKYMLPVYMYDHSGVTYSTTPFGCRWDSGRIGVIFMEEGLEDFEGLTQEQCKELLEAEIKEYSEYAEGHVYEYAVIRDSDGETVESCCGIVGSDAIEDGSDMIKEAIASADFDAKKQASYERPCYEI